MPRVLAIVHLPRYGKLNGRRAGAWSPPPRVLAMNLNLPGPAKPPLLALLESESSSPTLIRRGC